MENVLVNVVDPDTGDVGSLPQAQLADALSQGYVQASPEEVQSFVNAQKYGSVSQQAITALEGAASAATFGASTGIEKALGVNPEDIQGRREENPWSHGLGQVGGILATGPLAELSAANVMTKAGRAGAEALGLGLEGAGALSKIGAGAVTGAVESGIFQVGDEISKAFSDPEQSLGNAAINVGLATLIGAPVGGAIGAVGPAFEAMGASKLGQFIDDFKARGSEHINNPDPVGAMHTELDSFYKSMRQMGHDVYGSEGIKAQDIAKVLPEKTPEMLEKTAGIVQKMGDQLRQMKKDVDAYPSRLVNSLKKDITTFQNHIDGAQTSGEIFDGMNFLKRKWQTFVDDSGLHDNLAGLRSTDPAYEFSKQMDKFAKNLKNSLEDETLWGKAALRQKEINKAFSEYLPKLKNFESKFTSVLPGERMRIVDPTKINTYVNQLGKPNAELKQMMLKEFVDASETYRGVIDKSHANLGLENPYAGLSLMNAKKSLNELTPGAKLADKVFKSMPDWAGKTLAGGAGASIGAALGHPGLGFIIGEYTLGHTLKSILPALMKPLLENPTNPSAFRKALSMGADVIRGESLINKATKSVFKAGQEVLPSHLIPSEKKREKLDKILLEYKTNPERMFEMDPHGGEYLPDHNLVSGSLAANAVNILNSMRPEVAKQAPLDSDLKPSESQKYLYQRALGIAEQPLMVVQHIKEGTVLPQDVQILQGLYPGLYNKLVMKLTDNVINLKSKGEMIPYKTRLGLSLFMGEPLDSTMMPMSIQAAQPKAEQQNQPVPRAKHSMSALNKIGSSFATSAQAREKERNTF